jgi:beta-fructofuranosidase
MYWGHAVSPDLIHWDHLPPALSPDGAWENFLGCFSGSALVEKDFLALYYTGFSFRGQYQLRAVSRDGLHFFKDHRPVMGPDQLPPETTALNFRDPKVFRRDGVYYCLTGCRFSRGRRRGGEIALHTSPDGLNWDYRGPLLREELPYRGIFECPDLTRVGEKDILFASPMYLPSRPGGVFTNLHSVVYVPGNFLPGNLTDGGSAFVPEPILPGSVDDNLGGNRLSHYFRELDGGTDFYAPQTMTAPDGRIILVAWMQMWKRTIPTRREGWAGCMTIPRELSWKDGCLRQKPVGELKALRRNQRFFRNQDLSGAKEFLGVEGRIYDLEVDFRLPRDGAFEIELLRSPDGQRFFKVSYSRREERLTVDRSAAAVRVRSRDHREEDCSRRSRNYSLEGDVLGLRILVDHSAVEVFTADGRQAFSMLIYNCPEDRGVRFDGSSGTVLERLEMYDLSPPVGV